MDIPNLRRSGEPPRCTALSGQRRPALLARTRCGAPPLPPGRCRPALPGRRGPALPGLTRRARGLPCVPGCRGAAAR